jgi:hypothetical protein
MDDSNGTRRTVVRGTSLKRNLLYLALVALALLTVGASGSLAAGKQRGIAFDFSGKLLVTPSQGSPSLSVQVTGGNRPALKKLLGHSQNQSFAVDSNTQYLRWSHGVPEVVSESNLAAGDFVTIRVRAARDATLEQIEATAAKRVADRGPNPTFARRPLWLFIGTLTAPAANGRIALHITSGNWKALHAMLGQSLEQTFSYDEDTIFLLWQGRVPTVISAGQLKVGDRISVRIRAPRNASLAQVESTPANHVGDHEPPPPPQP